MAYPVLIILTMQFIHIEHSKANYLSVIPMVGLLNGANLQENTKY